MSFNKSGSDAEGEGSVPLASALQEKLAELKGDDPRQKILALHSIKQLLQLAQSAPANGGLGPNELHGIVGELQGMLSVQAGPLPGAGGGGDVVQARPASASAISSVLSAPSAAAQEAPREPKPVRDPSHPASALEAEIEDLIGLMQED